MIIMLKIIESRNFKVIQMFMKQGNTPTIISSMLTSSTTLQANM